MNRATERDALSRRAFLAAAGAAAFVSLGRAVEKVKAVAVTKGPKHHFFGYYDKTPWDQTGRYLLANEIDFCDRQPRPGEKLTVGMVDRKDKDRYIELDKTSAWSWQQGTMLQWLGTAPDKEVIYNSTVDGKFVSIIRDVHTGKTRQLPRSVYGVSPDGTRAVTLDFDRLHRLRPGYGYQGVEEKYKDDPAPREAGIYHMDLKTGDSKLIVPIAWAAANKPDDRMKGGHHWFNHLNWNPSGTRFNFLHRWRVFDRAWSTRMYTAKPDGTDLRLVWDAGMTSHFDWRDDHSILAWTRTKEYGDKFYLYDLKNDKYDVVGADVLTRDGHCSYSPDRKWILNDTYPDAKRLQTLMLFRVKDGRRFDLDTFHLPAKLTGPFRCDLHPRWNRDGTQVCIDSGHEETRQVYVLDVSDYVKG